jgi:5-carboxymethyl-2-hydroxymuconate isomerase
MVAAVIGSAWGFSMPQISVDYTRSLAGAFDRQGFGLALNELAGEIIDAKPGSCKIRFRPVEESIVGDAAEGNAIVFVDFQVFPGRTPEAKAKLSEAVLAALPRFLAGAGLPVHAAVNILDIDRDCYRGVTLEV